jgi:hypothetical protein
VSRRFTVPVTAGFPFAAAVLRFVCSRAFISS